MLSVADVDLRVFDMELRMPFSFGTVTVTRQPHLVVALECAVDGRRVAGLAADGLSPLWFLKEAPFREGMDAMRSTIESTAERARGLEAGTAFDWWRALYERQADWGESSPYPPLLWGYGVALFERAAIDATCRARETTFAEGIRSGAFGVEPGAIYGDLAGVDPADSLPDEPRRELTVRHTVGLDDPLTGADVDEPLDDGLPQSLAASIDAYGLTGFKVKLGGDPAADRERLARVADVVDTRVADPTYTLDANESYADLGRLREFWRGLDPRIADAVAFIEQPLPRDAAFTDATRSALAAWDGPPVIVDESDDRADRLATALDAGYGGTSHKNVKGVFKSVVNACLLAERGGLMSAEDASNVGPVALLQDLAVVASLGIDHAERNGHHYFRGLDPLPEYLAERTLEAHGDLYRRHERGFPTLDIDGGTISLDSAVEAPFGYDLDVEPERLAPYDEWAFTP